VELCLYSSNTPSWRGAQLRKYRENFNFTFLEMLKINKKFEKKYSTYIQL
jgi:hypothetical protein